MLKCCSCFKMPHCMFLQKEKKANTNIAWFPFIFLTKRSLPRTVTSTGLQARGLASAPSHRYRYRYTAYLDWLRNMNWITCSTTVLTEAAHWSKRLNCSGPLAGTWGKTVIALVVCWHYQCFFFNRLHELNYVCNMHSKGKYLESWLLLLVVCFVQEFSET